MKRKRRRHQGHDRKISDLSDVFSQGALSFQMLCKSRARLPSSVAMKCNEKKRSEMK
jgi:hypothetical protein